MKKILFVANVHKHFTAFHLPYIKLLREQGHEVHVAANGIDEVILEANRQIIIPFGRSPFHKSNYKAFFQLKKLIETEKYNLVTCHTSIASAITRLACIYIRKNSSTKLLYTVHGFDFSKYSSLKSWLMYYPMEKFLSRFTDGMVIINNEDYNLILRKNFSNKDTFLINGIGVNGERFGDALKTDKVALRKEYGYKNNDFILIYIAEFISRKNHIFIIDSVNELKNEIPELKIIFVGKGNLLAKMQEISEKKGLSKIIDFFGFRKDIGNLIRISDIGISASKLEGLPMNISEEQLMGLPVVATHDKGHEELIQHGFNGFLFPQNNQAKFIEYIKSLYYNKELRNRMGRNASEYVKKFDISVSLTQMDEIYKKYL
jgi:glycosyltransferase EpsD